MKTLIALSLTLLCWLLPASNSQAAIVTWGFNGVLTRADNLSNAVPNTVAIGTPFTGVITYDPGAISGSDANASPDFADYYFRTNSAFSITMIVGGATFTSTNTTPQNNFAGINIGNNQANAYDALTYYSAGLPLVNGLPAGPGVTEGSLEIDMFDLTQTAFTSDAIPTIAPNPAAYTVRRITVIAYAPGAENRVFYISGNIAEITTLPKVILSYQKLAANQLRLSWPVSATGLTLQFATSLTSQDWTTEPTAVVDTATEHTVTLSTTGQPKFFRLVKLPAVSK